MELVFGKWVFPFALSCWIIFSGAYSVEGLRGSSQVRGVNLGGWLVVEGWIKPSLFDGIPNGDMLDGTEVHFKFVSSQKHVSADSGGGMGVTEDRDVASSWETFKHVVFSNLTFLMWKVVESFCIRISASYLSRIFLIPRQ